MAIEKILIYLGKDDELLQEAFTEFAKSFDMTLHGVGVPEGLHDERILDQEIEISALKLDLQEARSEAQLWRQKNVLNHCGECSGSGKHDLFCASCGRLLGYPGSYTRAELKDRLRRALVERNLALAELERVLSAKKVEDEPQEGA